MKNTEKSLDLSVSEEKEIMLYDRIVLERHDYTASKAEISKGQPQL